MPALDTNVLVRWLTNDDAAQCAEVAVLFQQTVASGTRLFVPTTVVLELEWVLRSRYRFDPAAVARALDAILAVPYLALMEEAALEQALWLFKQDGAPDFADCLHTSLAFQHGHAPLLTFDTKAARLNDAKLLGRAPGD